MFKFLTPYTLAMIRTHNLLFQYAESMTTTCTTLRHFYNVVYKLINGTPFLQKNNACNYWLVARTLTVRHNAVGIRSQVSKMLSAPAKMSVLRMIASRSAKSFFVYLI
jgi:hypothetical protein